MSRCRGCDAPIIWATTRLGSRMPLDEEPTRQGNMVLLRGEARHATEDDRALRRPIYASHFETCPKSGEWRRPKHR